MTMKRGPKSAASLTVVPLDTARSRSRIPTPKNFTGAQERSLFAETVTHFPHLKTGDTPQLALYVQNVIGALKLSKKSDAASIKSCDTKARAALALARSLRLTQISQSHPETLARGRSNHSTSSYYDTMRDNGDE